jgi:hypothetical protein
MTALRKANKILADAKVSWMELLAAVRQAEDFRVPPSKRRPQPRADDEFEDVAGGKYDDAGEIDRLFDRAFAEDHAESFEAFLTSIHMWWERRGYLTERQYRALKKAARR